MKHNAGFGLLSSCGDEARLSLSRKKVESVDRRIARVRTDLMN